MVAKATDSLDTSVADVVASIGSLKVANLELLENLDLTDDLNVLSGAGDTVSNLLNEGLNLPGLLDVDILKITELVEPDGDYTSALSSLTALGVSVNPLVGALQAGSDEPTAAGILGDGLPVLGGDMDLLGGLLGGVTSVLSDGAGIEVGTMASEGFFTPVAALPPGIVTPPAQTVTTPDGKLPRTGANTALPALMAVLLAGAALGVRRVVRAEKLNG
jgi:LPXTG-motif cell wall-anchored protein